MQAHRRARELIDEVPTGQPPQAESRTERDKTGYRRNKERYIVETWKLAQFIERKGFPGGSVVKKKKKTHLLMQETWAWSLGQEDPLEEEMATHSSIFAWKIPQTDEPGRLQSMESQKDWDLT